MKKNASRLMYAAPSCCLIDTSPYSLLAGLSAEGGLDSFDIDTNPSDWGETSPATRELEE